MKKRLLIINHSDPFANGGGSFASHAYCKAFSDIASGNIDICIFEDSIWPIDESIRVQTYYKVKQRSIIERSLSIFNGNIQRYSGFAKKLLANKASLYDFVVMNGSYEGGGLVDLFHRYGIKVITIHHNYDPEYAYDNMSIPVFRSLYKYYVFKLQKKAYLKSDLNLFLTNEDMQTCREKFGKTNAKASVVGVFDFKEPDIVQLSTQRREVLTFIITGSLCTVQGVDGIKYFFNVLYKHLPVNSKVIIAGRSPKDEVIKLCARHPNVELIPNPHNMMEVISTGDIYICPTRLGGGLKLRVMDGLKMGLPVITHFCSARGYDAFENSPFFKSFNTEDEFKCILNAMVENCYNNNISKKDVYECYIGAFSYKSGLERLKNILNEGSNSYCE